MIDRRVWEWEMASWRVLIWKLPPFGIQESWPWHWLQVLLVLSEGIRFKMKEWLQGTGQDIGKVHKRMLKLFWCLRMIHLQFIASPKVKNRCHLFKCPKIPPVENEGVSEPGSSQPEANKWVWACHPHSPPRVASSDSHPGVALGIAV